MLAGMRSRFLLLFLLAFSAACLPVQSQINGPPPSVTSIGFGGRFINGVPPSVTSIGFGGRFINGVSPSVTSLGPNGYGDGSSVSGDCCANIFMPASPNPPLFSRRHHSGRHHHHGDHAAFAVGVSEPAYIPYAVPYDQEEDDDPLNVDQPDAGYVHAPGTRSAKAASREPAPGDPEEPVDAQLATVLVFKDGHQSDVLNYAIVGDTLYAFGTGRTKKILLADLDLPATRKANDDRGVDFQIPASIARQ
jgi:hypothetical protein